MKYRPANINEVKSIVSGLPVIVSPYQETAGLFLIDLNGCAEGDVLSAMKANAFKSQFLFEHLVTVNHYGRPTIEIRLRVNKSAKGEAQFAGRACVRKPTNYGFEPKPKRIAHMGHFIKAGDFTSAQFEGSESAFVNRLFDEGMLEKNPDKLSEMRPTPEGVQWYMAHTVSQSS